MYTLFELNTSPYMWNKSKNNKNYMGSVQVDRSMCLQVQNNKKTSISVIKLQFATCNEVAIKC